MSLVSSGSVSHHQQQDDSFLHQQNPEYLSLIQISDLHLFDDPAQRYNGIDTNQSFEQVLQLISRDFNQADCLAVTGDLLQQPSSESYTQLFSRIDKLNIPFITTAGNHDVTMELDPHLPFIQRRHVPMYADERLSNRYLIKSEYWDIIFLDSTVRGHINGRFSQETLDWLSNTLASSDRPCVLFAHHPMLLVGSAWIDQHTLQNPTEFWQVVTPFASRIKGIFVGHVHQELQLVNNGISLFTCPSTGVQFKSFCDDYTIDELMAGLRWVTLYNNGKLATGIKRIDTV